MSENAQTVKIDSLDLVKISKDDVVKNVAEIVVKNIAVYRLNNENKLVTIPVNKIEQFLGEAESINAVFYIDKNWNEPIKSLAGMHRNPEDSTITNFHQKLMDSLQKHGNTIDQIENFQKKSIVEREEILDKSIERLHEVKGKGAKFDLATVIQMVDVVANTFYANYANFEDSLATENIKNNYFGIYIKTEWAIQLIIEFFRNNDKAYTNYKAIDEISTGSYTIDNMSRATLWFIGFCLFYNDYIDKGFVAKKLRVEFKDKHHRYYKKLLPDQALSLERIVKNGFRRIDIETELPMLGVGALLYDVGKLPFTVYHDGVDAYDENLVKMHVLAGYNMIQTTKKYPFPVSAMSAFHHEYYGGKGSYNFTNPIISKLTQKKRADVQATYFISYDEKDYKDGISIAYFPCKVIEIIDVYNALVHKKKNPPVEALRIMKKNFIAQSLKIDPLLFDIFMEFLMNCGLLQQSERGEIDAIIY
jgi:hypothetical protein